jgi:hypothetical protein
MHGTRQPILGFASINYMNKEYQMRDRIKFLARSVTSNISRYQGHEFFVEFFLYPFALELAQENAGKPGFQFRPDKIDQNEFNLVVEMYRKAHAGRVLSRRHANIGFRPARQGCRLA